MRSKLFLFLIFLFSLYIVYSKFYIGRIAASHCPSTDYQCQIDEIQREIDGIAGAHEKNKEELASLQEQLVNLDKRIAGISAQLEELEVEITQREEDLGFARRIFEEKANNHYRFLRLYDPIIPFLSSHDAAEAFREISFRQKAADEDRKTMEKYADDLFQLKTDKENLEKSKLSLASAKAQVDERENFLSGEVNKVESYITSLTSKQQELAALKAGGFSTSVGDTPATLEPCSGPPGSSNYCDPGFRPAFSFFTFGYPHRTGMSQYGAYGRSKKSQSAETILSAYYQGASLDKNYPVPQTISVSGYGSIPFEDNYLLGIYEVPESWGDSGGFEALKAQAVAARSYALYYVSSGAAICTTESCQVYKPQLKTGKWTEAVKATRGWVMVKGGSPANTYYASTAGGFTISQWGWTGIKDAEDGDWPNRAYDNTGGSPWFYKGWYKSRSGSTCGRSHPWMTEEEMADLINAWAVLYDGAGGDTSRISPIDTGCWGGNPYSMTELRSIGGYTDVYSVSVIYSNDGSTQTVTVSTNKGTKTIPGGQFSDSEEGVVNLRAPGYIGVKTSLFNVEKL